MSLAVADRVFESVPNFSEGRDGALVAALAAGSPVLDVHSDADHNRCVVTLAGADLPELLDDLTARIALAVERIDLRAHTGVHPRVGAADVVPLVPLGGASMNDAVDGARILGERVWRELRVPVFFYGEAAGGRRLRDIRAGTVKPDLGGRLHPTAGAVCVGARRPLVAYNLVMSGMDLARVRQAVPSMRQLPGVQALSFPLAGGRSQLSMNLTRIEETTVRDVFEAAARLLGAPGLPELVGLCPAHAAGPGCDGGLLEARLAGAAARAAGTIARSRGGAEMDLLAARLEAEGRSLGAVGADQDAVLGGAERAAALIRVLRAGGLDDPAREAMLRVAASGLRAAVRADTAERLHRRVALLDRQLGLLDVTPAE